MACNRLTCDLIVISIAPPSPPPAAADAAPLPGSGFTYGDHRSFETAVSIAGSIRSLNKSCYRSRVRGRKRGKHLGRIRHPPHREEGRPRTNEGLWPISVLSYGTGMILGRNDRPYVGRCERGMGNFENFKRMNLKCPLKVCLPACLYAMKICTKSSWAQHVGPPMR